MFFIANKHLTLLRNYENLHWIFPKPLTLLSLQQRSAKKGETTEWRTGNRDVPQPNQNQVSFAAAKSDGGCFFSFSCCLKVHRFTGVHTLTCQWVPISVGEILVPSCSERPSLCHCWTPTICSQPENVTFDSGDWSRLLDERRALTQMCVPLLHICFPSRPSHASERFWDVRLRIEPECFCLAKVGLGHSSSSVVALYSCWWFTEEVSGHFIAPVSFMGEGED